MNIEEIKKNIEQELNETKDIKSLNDLENLFQNLEDFLFCL